MPLQVEKAEKARERYRRWRAENREHVKEQKRLRYAKHREAIIAQNKAWEDAHPECRRAKKSNYRARVRSCSGKFTGEEFRQLCERYGNVCLCCGEDKPLTADHVIPFSKGGSNTIDNIQPLCNSCNKKKHARSFDYRQGKQPDAA